MPFAGIGNGARPRTLGVLFKALEHPGILLLGMVGRVGRLVSSDGGFSALRAKNPSLDSARRFCGASLERPVQSSARRVLSRGPGALMPMDRGIAISWTDAEEPGLMNSKTIPWVSIGYWLVWAFLCLIFLVKARESLQSIKQPLTYSDTYLFFDAAKHPIASPKFFTSYRPPTVPFLYKMMGLKEAVIVRGQLAIHILCHTILALFAFLVLGRKIIGLIAASAIWLYALSPEVNTWTQVVLGETIMFSFLALQVASLGWFLLELYSPKLIGRRLAPSAVCFLLTSMIYSFTRDNLAFQLMINSIALIVVWLRFFRLRSQQIWRLGCSLGAMVFLLLCIRAQMRWADADSRLMFNLTNVFCQRIIPDAETRELFAKEHGMPNDEKLLAFGGKWATELRIDDHPAFASWFRGKAQTAYRRFILRHPFWAMDQAWRGFRLTVNDYASSYYKNAPANGFLARWSHKTIFRLWPNAPEIAMLLCLLIPLFVALSDDSNLSYLAWATWAFALGLPLQWFVCYLGDAMEVSRHCAGAAVGLRLLLVLCAILVLAQLGKGLHRFIQLWKAKPATQASPNPDGG